MSEINIMSVDCAALECPSGLLGAASNITTDCLDVDLSQLSGIILWHPTEGTAPTNWGSGMLVTDFDIDNTDPTGVKQKRFPLVGNLPKPEYQKITTIGFNSVTVLKTRAFNFRIYHVNGVNYDFLRKVECGKVRPKFIMETEGGYLLGKDGGIDFSDIELDAVWNEGETEVEYWEGVISFKTKVSPDRVLSPLPSL